jgi:hypothetical protein
MLPIQPVFTSDAPASVQQETPHRAVWRVLSEAFGLGWAKRPYPSAAGTLDELEGALGREALGVAYHNHGVIPCRSHTTKTKRLTWQIVGDESAPDLAFVFLHVSRPQPDDAADDPHHVIEVTVESPDEECRACSKGAPCSYQGGAHPWVASPSVPHVLEGGYGRRHVVLVHTALMALTKLPPSKGGITKKNAVLVVNMLMAGAS